MSKLNRRGFLKALSLVPVSNLLLKPDVLLAAPDPVEELRKVVDEVQSFGPKNPGKVVNIRNCGYIQGVIRAEFERTFFGAKYDEKYHLGSYTPSVITASTVHLTTLIRIPDPCVESGGEIAWKFKVKNYEISIVGFVSRYSFWTKDQFRSEYNYAVEISESAILTPIHTGGFN